MTHNQVRSMGRTRYANHPPTLATPAHGNLRNLRNLRSDRMVLDSEHCGFHVAIHCGMVVTGNRNTLETRVETTA